MKRHGLRVAAYALLLTLWEFIAARVNPIFLVGPSEVARALYEGLVVSGDLLEALGVTAIEFVCAVAVSILIGVPLGIWLALSLWANFVLGPLLRAVYVVPRIAFVPLLVLWFGIGFAAKTAIGISLGVFPVLFGTEGGVRTTGQHYADVIRAFGGNRRQAIVFAIVPGALPHIFTAIDIGAGLALVGVIVGEMFTSLAGIGGMLVESAHAFRTDRLLAATIVTAVFGWSALRCIRAISHRLAPWTRTRLDEASE